MINDTYGHKMGDKVIHASAKAMQEVFSDEEILVRMGGNEFLIIGKFTDEAFILKKEQQIDEFLEKFTLSSDLPFELKVSMGHVWNEGNVNSIEELVQLADHVMYEKKQERKRKSKCELYEKQE